MYKWHRFSQRMSRSFKEFIELTWYLLTHQKVSHSVLVAFCLVIQSRRVFSVCSFSKYCAWVHTQQVVHNTILANIQPIHNFLWVNSASTLSTHLFVFCTFIFQSRNNIWSWTDNFDILHWLQRFSSSIFAERREEKEKQKMVYFCIFEIPF